MEFLIFLPALPAVALGLWLDSMFARKAREKITAWAASENYAVTEVRRSWTGGPLWYLVRQGIVFKVTLSNNSGTEKAWIFYPLPISFYKMKVRWADD